MRVSVHTLNGLAIPPLDRKLFAPFPFCFLLACFFLCMGGAEARKLVADSSLKSYMRPEAMDINRRLLAQLYSSTVNIGPNQWFAVGPITGYSCIKFSVSASDEDHEKVMLMEKYDYDLYKANGYSGSSYYISGSRCQQSYTCSKTVSLSSSKTYYLLIHNDYDGIFGGDDATTTITVDSCSSPSPSPSTYRPPPPSSSSSSPGSGSPPWRYPPANTPSSPNNNSSSRASGRASGRIAGIAIAIVISLFCGAYRCYARKKASHPDLPQVTNQPMTWHQGTPQQGVIAPQNIEMQEVAPQQPMPIPTYVATVEPVQYDIPHVSRPMETHNKPQKPFCTNCGNVMSEDDKFCGKCGKGS
jgi:hypothetical protein